MPVGAADDDTKLGPEDTMPSAQTCRCEGCGLLTNAIDTQYDGQGRLICRLCHTEWALAQRGSMRRVPRPRQRRPREDNAPHLIRQRRTRLLLAPESDEVVVDLVHAGKRLRARRELQLLSWFVIVLWVALLALTVHLGLWQADLWSPSVLTMIALGVGLVAITGTILSTIRYVSVRDAAGIGTDTTLPRIVVFRRFSYFLDLRCLSTLTPPLLSLGRICFIPNPMHKTPTGIRDPGGMDLSSREPKAPTLTDVLLGRAPKEDDSAYMVGTMLAARTFLHPTPYMTRAPFGTVEARRTTATGWVSEARQLAMTSDFAVVDITGFNSNMEIEVMFVTSLMPANRILFVCCAGRGVPANRIVDVHGTAVFMYTPSMWGTGPVSNYIIEHFRKSFAGAETDAVPIADRSDEVMGQLQGFGRKGRRAAIRIPFEIHTATTGFVGTALVLVVFGFFTAKHGGRWPSIELILGGAVIGLTAVVQYLLLMLRWLLELAADRA
jgi:hypothetical protein